MTRLKLDNPECNETEPNDRQERRT